MEVIKPSRGKYCALLANLIRSVFWFFGRLFRGLACQFFSLVLLMAYLTPATAATPAGSSDLKQQEVARIVLGILSYTKWQPARNPVQLCLVGSTDYTAALQSSGLSGKNFKGIISRQDFNIDSLNAQCDAIYFGDISPQQQQKVTGSKDHPVLTISESNPDCELGSMFCLNVDSSPVTFKVNLDSLAKSGIHVNPNVLLLGRKKKVAP